MIRVEVPGRGVLEFHHLVLDLNGTLATDGLVPPPVSERVRVVSASLEVHIVTADTFGTAGTLEGLGVKVVRLPPGDQVAAKADIVRALGSDRTVAIGNGMNDMAMLREAALGILVIGREGAAVRSLLAADLVVRDFQPEVGHAARDPRLERPGVAGVRYRRAGGARRYPGGMRAEPPRGGADRELARLAGEATP